MEDLNWIGIQLRKALSKYFIYLSLTILSSVKIILQNKIYKKYVQIQVNLWAFNMKISIFELLGTISL